MVDCTHPYWGQSVQCREGRQASQQQAKPSQPQPQARQLNQPNQPGRRDGRGGRNGNREHGLDGFDSEFVNKPVRVRLTDGELSGVIVQAARFWVKLDTGGVVHYINKAYIVEIIPQAT